VSLRNDAESTFSASSSAVQPRRGLWRDHPAVMVALTFCAVGLTYIALSDQIVSWLVSDSDRLTLIQTYKGWAFIAVTTILIYLLVRHSVNQMRQAQAQRRAIDERYRRMIETTNEGVVLAGADGRCQYVNRTFAEMIGASPGEIMHKHFTERVAEHQRPMVERMLSDPDSDGPYRFDCELKRKDGSSVWTIVSASPVTDSASGRRTATLFMITDITPRKLAERALERNIEVQRVLVNELDHRVRNNLSSLAALIDLSRGSAANVDDFARSITARVQAMAKAHALAGQAAAAGMDLRRVVEEMVPPHLRARLTFDGPPVVVDHAAIIPLAMLMHEMLTRSERGGALADPVGRASVRWHRKDDARNGSVDLTWSESSARACARELDREVASDIIAGLVRSDLRGSIEPTADGYRMQLSVHQPVINGV
jgi:PAS domain S-box-containing protein